MKATLLSAHQPPGVAPTPTCWWDPVGTRWGTGGDPVEWWALRWVLVGAAVGPGWVLAMPTTQRSSSSSRSPQVDPDGMGRRSRLVCCSRKALVK